MRRARERHPTAAGLKLYNASTFFEPASIAQHDLRPVAAALAGLSLVVVEARSENARAAVEFARLIDGRLEVAIGVEAADDELLRALNKPTSTRAFRAAAQALTAAGVFLRAFVLIKPPFVGEGEAVALAVRTFELARDEGARVVSLLPVVAADAPLERLGRAGFHGLPSLDTVWEAAVACAGRGVVVIVELEHLVSLPACPACGERRRAALAELNRGGRLGEVGCTDHRPPAATPVRPFSSAAVLAALR